MSGKEFEAEENATVQLGPVYNNYLQVSTSEISKHPDMKAAVKKESSESYSSEMKYSKIKTLSNVSAVVATSTTAFDLIHTDKQQEENCYPELKSDAKLTNFQNSLHNQYKFETVQSKKTHFKRDKMEQTLQNSKGNEEWKGIRALTPRVLLTRIRISKEMHSNLNSKDSFDVEESRTEKRQKIYQRKTSTLSKRTVQSESGKYDSDFRYILCSVCPKIFSTKKTFRRHMGTHSIKRRVKYLCVQCNKWFSESGALKTHVKHIHTFERRFRCSYCNKAFITKSALGLHLLVHSSEKPYTCDHCQKSFSQRATLKNHLNSAHLKLKSFHCSHCAKMFTSQSSLQNHLKTVKGKKGFTCSYCNTKFLRKSYLTSHIMAVHIKGKVCKCLDCGKTFSLAEYLRKHQVEVHQRKGNYECMTCKKVFKRKEHLHLHTRSHSGEKPFECDFCHQRFSQKPSIARHIRAHIGEKPFLCHLCSSAFVDSGDLNKHIQRHLGDKTLSVFNVRSHLLL